MQIKLRDMTKEDIEDYVRWFTEETTWMKTDAPWEFAEAEPTTAEAERSSWTEYYEEMRDRPADAPRWKFEIEADGRHVGWVSCYDDLEYVPNPEEIPAVGIDIPDVSVWGRGVATTALRMYLDYLKKPRLHLRLHPDLVRQPRDAPCRREAGLHRIFPQEKPPHRERRAVRRGDVED